MNDPHNQPPLPSQTPQRSSGGSGSCMLKGCLIVTVVLMLLGVGVGAFGWYVYHGVKPFFTQEPVPIRAFEGGDAAYTETQAKIAAFNQTVASGQPATLILKENDLNALVTHDPRFAELRRGLYLSIVNNQIVAETSFPVNDEKSVAHDQRVFFNARVILDASYSSGDFTFLLSRVETLDHQQPPSFMMGTVRSYLAILNQAFNRNFHDRPEDNQDLKQVMEQIRTIVIKDNQIVATSVDHPKPAATPTPAPSPASESAPSPSASPVAGTPEPR